MSALSPRRDVLLHGCVDLSVKNIVYVSEPRSEPRNYKSLSFQPNLVLPHEAIGNTCAHTFPWVDAADPAKSQLYTLEGSTAAILFQVKLDPGQIR